MKRLFLIPLLLSGPFTHAQESNAFSLQQAMDYAAKNSPLVKNATIDIEIYKQKVKEVLSYGLPQINAEGTFNHFLNIPTTVVPANAFNPFADPDMLVPVQFGTKYQTQAGVTASQLIFDGSFLVGVKAAKSVAAMQLQLEQKADIDIKAEVVKAYYMAAVADENIKTLELTLQNIEKLRNETDAINKEGLIEKQDVEQLDLTVESMRNNISRAQNIKKTAYNLLKLNMGIDVNQEISLSENIDQLNAAFNAADYQNKEFSVGNLPEFKLLQTQIALNELNLRAEKMRRYPSLGAFISHSYTLPSNKLDQFDNRRWFPTTIWGLKLTVPIWSSGTGKARIEQARLTIEKSANQMKNAENGLKLAAENARLNFNFAMESLTQTKHAMELADRIHQKTLIKYKEGMASSLELNQTQMQYLSAQANYINGLYNLLNSKAEMDKAYGLIQPASLNSTNTTPNN